MIRDIIRKIRDVVVGSDDSELRSSPAGATTWSYWGDDLSSESGVNVSAASALGDAAFWRAVNLISRDIAKTPIHLYRRTPDDGGRIRATNHPAWMLLLRRPSRYMTAFVLKQTLQAHALMYGNGYAYIFRDRVGRPVEILPLDPTATFPVRENGELLYVTQYRYAGREERRKLPPGDVFHLAGLGFDGLIGYNVITVARNVIGLSLGMRSYTSRFFSNNACPGVVLEFPGTVTKQQHDVLRKVWEEMHRGIDRAHRVAVIGGGGKVSRISVEADKAQLVQARQHSVREIANILGVPAYKLGDPEHRTFSSTEQADKDYLAEALDPWMVAWESEAWSKLLTEEEKSADEYFFEFQRAALIRVDHRSETESLIAEVNNGLLSVDEARAIRNRPALPDGLGSRYRIPANIMTMDGRPAGEASDGSPAGDSRLSLSREMRDILNANAARMVRRLSSQARRSAAAGADAYAKWRRSAIERNRRVVREALGSFSDVFLRAVDEIFPSADDGGDDLVSRVSSAGRKLEQESWIV